MSEIDEQTLTRASRMFCAGVIDVAAQFMPAGEAKDEVQLGFERMLMEAEAGGPAALKEFLAGMLEEFMVRGWVHGAGCTGTWSSAPATWSQC